MKKLILVSFICSIFAVLSFAAKEGKENKNADKPKAEKVTVSGPIKCGRCDLGEDKCRKFIQAKDGKQYNIFMKSKKFAEWWAANKGNKAAKKHVTAVGTIRKSKKSDMNMFRIKKIEATKAASKKEA